MNKQQQAVAQLVSLCEKKGLVASELQPLLNLVCKTKQGWNELNPVTLQLETQRVLWERN